jgi:hypothetical protein
MALMVLRTCEQIEGGLPADVKTKMYLNIILDFGLGLCPLVGDIADALFRANTRNAVVLEKHLRQKGAKALKAQGHSTPPVDPSDPNEYDRQLREEHGPPPQYTGQTTQQDRQAENHGQTHSTQARVHQERGGGWFSGFGSKKRERDVEHGSELQMREEANPAVATRPN